MLAHAALPTRFSFLSPIEVSEIPRKQSSVNSTPPIAKKSTMKNVIAKATQAITAVEHGVNCPCCCATGWFW